jgi:hypothetical protein
MAVMADAAAPRYRQRRLISKYQHSERNDTA